MHQLFILTAMLKNQETKEIEGFSLCYSTFTSPVQSLFFPVRSSLGLPLSFTGSVKKQHHTPQQKPPFTTLQFSTCFQPDLSTNFCVET
ncbi:MAG: hypothetical protein COC06_05495 [Bacteroidales bacterium]|nr:MAG: hypothetical protein COC06_05495 [Bacteroidales bacterium]